MFFVAFLLIIWAIAVFHQKEHKAYIKEMRVIAENGQIGNLDWRKIREDQQYLCLRRAFNIRNKSDLIRYGLPVIFFAAMLIVFGKWFLSFFYLAVIVVKWFATVTEVSYGANPHYYRLSLAGLPVWTEKL